MWIIWKWLGNGADCKQARRSVFQVPVVNHLFRVEGSNVVAPEVNCDLICISFPLVIRNNNVSIQNAYSSRSRHSHASVIHAGLNWPTMVPLQTDRSYRTVLYTGSRAPEVSWFWVYFIFFRKNKFFTYCQIHLLHSSLAEGRRQFSLPD